LLRVAALELKTAKSQRAKDLLHYPRCSHKREPVPRLLVKPLQQKEPLQRKKNRRRELLQRARVIIMQRLTKKLPRRKLPRRLRHLN